MLVDRANEEPGMSHTDRQSARLMVALRNGRFPPVACRVLARPAAAAKHALVASSDRTERHNARPDRLEGKASMRRIAMLVAMSILATHAAAIERHNVSQMSREAVGRALQSEHRSILRYHSARVDKLMLYDIYVRDYRSCKPGEAAVPTRVPAKDGLYRVLRCATVTVSFSRL
jgi:hypothetical protein